MFDTMRLTKIVGSLCGALLIFLMGNWAAESLYSVGGGHGDDHHQAYVIDTGEDEEGGEAAAEAGPSFAELYASADLDNGARVFNKCKACHQLEDGANGVGPHLYGVVGRDVGAADGFGYSGALSEAADVWTPEELDAFLEKPSGYAPGTSMGFAGLGKLEDRVNVIAYLDQTDGDMTEMDVPQEEAAAESEAESEAEAPAPDVAEALDDAEGAVESAAEAAEEAADTVADAVQDAGEAVAETAEGAGDAAADMADAVVDEVAEAAEDAAADVSETVEQAGEPATTDTQDGSGGEEAAGGFAALVAAADPAEGEKVFRKCKACHLAEDGKNRAGPHLYNVVDRDIGSVEGFNYSDAVAGKGGAWTLEALDAWLTDPKAFIPGNRMTFPGLKTQEERAALVAYLQSVGG